EDSKAFRIYVIKPNESVSINSIIESKDAIFDENRFSSAPKLSQRSLINEIEDIGALVVPEVDNLKTFDKAMKSQDVALWKEVISDEMDSIMGNNTWVLADLPPVARISTIRLLIAMTSIHNLIIHQMDMKTTFLNGDLDEEAPKQWHQKFNEVVLSNGNLLNQADKCVYSKFDESEADVILGIRIKHESNGIAISQFHYIEKVLKKFNYFDCTPVSTPMDTSEKLLPNNGQDVSQLEYLVCA
ncbi:zinc finger, CCHC-type containing protein, partial [Tanacetum coccineum]